MDKNKPFEYPLQYIHQNMVDAQNRLEDVQALRQTQLEIVELKQRRNAATNQIRKFQNQIESLDNQIKSLENLLAILVKEIK